MGNFQDVFLIILSLFSNLKLMSDFYFIYKKFLVYNKLEIFKNCKEVKHIIMIVAIIYFFFLSYMIYIWSQLKITFRKSSAPLKKSTPPCLFTHSTLKIDVCFPCLQKYKIIIVDKGWICIFFFYQGFLSQTTLTIHSTAGVGRGKEREHSFIPLCYHPLVKFQAFICNFACEMTITCF